MQPGDAEEFKLPLRPVVPTPEPAAAEVRQASPEAAPAGVLSEFVSDLEASLGDGFLPPPPAAPPRAELQARAATRLDRGSIRTPPLRPRPRHAACRGSAPAMEDPAPRLSLISRPRSGRWLPKSRPRRAKVDAASVDLADMFGELKHELEEDAANPQEDPETHYNLGVAFREMGLLDEAIGELQKVCQAVDRGHDFPQLMQTYTWLAQCFLDKGVAEAAIRWYERALKLPNIDEETRTALNYELASSYEAAGNKTTALNYFMEVYGSNIDYRDVAERIKALKS